MDFPCTQVIVDDNECTSTNRLDFSSQSQARSRKQVAILTVGAVDYPIYRGVNTIGRHPLSDISIVDSTVSKHHGEIEATSSEASAWISDLNSSNKTKLNNAVLRPDRCYELKHGSVIDFGRVRATYKFQQALNDSTVPETPAVDRRRKPLEEVVAATPDSSLNNSSGLAGDVSAIPATQDFLTTFRTPQLPHQQQPVQSLATTRFLTSSPRNDNLAEATSSTSDRNICPDSDDEASICEVSSRNEHLKQTTNLQVRTDFCPDSDDEACVSDTETRQREQPAASVTSTLQAGSRNDSPVDIGSHKAPTNCPSFSHGISIHDMETQKPEELIDNLRACAAKKSPGNCTEMLCDIHDMETQIDDLVVDARKKRLILHSPRNNSPDRDSERGTKTSIYDMETQKPEEIMIRVSEITTKKLFSNHNEIQCDIHDMETQIDDLVVNARKKHLIAHSPRSNNPDKNSERGTKDSIYDIEMQKSKETIDGVSESDIKKLSHNRSEVQCNIHDMETQKDDSLVNTARKSLIVHSPENNSPDRGSECEKKTSIYDMETQKLEATRDRVTDNATQKLSRNRSEIRCDIHNMETQKEDLPVKTARKSLIVHSPTNDNSHSNSGPENQVGIYDLETQKPFQENRQVLDIHDMETQNVFSDDACKDQAATNSRNELSIDINTIKVPVDMERISDPENQDNTEDIYDKETQCPDDVALIMSESPLTSLEQNHAQKDKVVAKSLLPDSDRQSETTNDSTSQIETQKINSGSGNREVSISKSQNFENEQTMPDPLHNGTEVRDNTNCPNSLDEPSSPPQERLKLSLEANFEEDCKELDVSVSNLGSQNLLENFGDSLAQEHLNMTSPHGRSSDANKGLNQYTASSEEDDIFNAATQEASTDEEDIFNAVTQRITVKNRKNLKNSFESVDSETDEEGVFQNVAPNSTIRAANNTERSSTVNKMNCDKDEEALLRLNTCETQKIVINKSVIHQLDINAADDDDSITDEEGFFTQFVEKANYTARPSSIVQENDNNCSHNSDSDDIYDLPTQPIKLSTEERHFSEVVAECEDKNKELDETVIIPKKNDTLDDKGLPTVIGKENAAGNPVLQSAYNVDDMAPTQLIHAPAAADSSKNSPSYKENENAPEMLKENQSKELATESDINDMAPTQVIHIPSNESSLSNSTNLIMIETQPYNLNGDNISPIDSSPCFKKNEGTSGMSKENRSKELDTVSDIDDMAPTQVIRVLSHESPLNNQNSLIMIETQSCNLKGDDVSAIDSPPCFKKNEGKFEMTEEKKSEKPVREIASDINEMGPTQVIYDPSNKPQLNSPDSLILKNYQSTSKEDDPSDMDILPTQMIRIPKETFNTEDSDDPSDGYSSDASGLYTAQKCGIEDIDYEMAPTQLISDVEIERNAKNIKKGCVKKTRGKSQRKTKINLDDTIERNLNNMFDGDNTEEVQEPPMLSTQSLQKVLQSSQDGSLSENTATTSNEIMRNNIMKQSSNIAIITTNENTDSQNSENYFSTMTSTRKKNMFKDSQNSTNSAPNKCLAQKTIEEQGASIDEINSARESNAYETITESVEQIRNIENTVLENQNIIKSLVASDQKNTRDVVKNDAITPLSEANDELFDEYLIPKISESLVHTSIVINDDEVDIMDGLPEVAKQVHGVSGGSKASNQNSKRVSINRKRSLPKRVENEQIDTKSPNETEPEAKVFKRKDSESKEDMGGPKRARRSRIKNAANTKQSPSIRNFFPKRESPLTIERPQSPVPFKENQRNKKSMENTNKSLASANTTIDTNPPEKSAKRTRRKVTEAQITSSTSLSDDGEQAELVKSKRSRNLQKLSLNIHSALSEESQEVEMILSRSIIEPKANAQMNVKSTEVPKQETKGRRGRKRLNPNESKSSDKRTGNTSSEASASEQPSFEVPASKPKRAKMSNVSITFMSDTSVTEPSKKSIRSGRYSQRSLANSSTSMSSQSPSPSKTRQKVLFTGITNTNDYTKILTKLGASQVEETTKCTVLVTDKVRRTVKFLCALAQSTPIVSVEWLVVSEQMGQFVDMDAYILSDKESEKKFGFKLKTSLEKAQTHKLLGGYTVILTPNVAPPPIPDLKSIISACGGKPLIRPPTKWPEKAVIISNETDMANAKKLLAKAPKEVSVQSTEFLLTGILQQQLNFVKFKLI